MPILIFLFVAYMWFLIFNALEEYLQTTTRPVEKKVEELEDKIEDAEYLT